MNVGFTYSKKDVKDTAQDIFTEIYIVLFDSDSDKGEEILVSILAKELAIKNVDRIILANPHSNPINTATPWSTMRFWLDVKKELIKNF